MSKLSKQQRKWYRKAAELQAEIDASEPEVLIPPLTHWNGDNLWDDCEMFGLVLEDPELVSLDGFYRDPVSGSLYGNYWVSDYGDPEIELTTIDEPPFDGNWDAIPVNGIGRAAPTL